MIYEGIVFLVSYYYTTFSYCTSFMSLLHNCDDIVLFYLFNKHFNDTGANIFYPLCRKMHAVAMQYSLHMCRQGCSHVSRSCRRRWGSRTATRCNCYIDRFLFDHLTCVAGSPVWPSVWTRMRSLVYHSFAAFLLSRAWAERELNSAQTSGTFHVCSSCTFARVSLVFIHIDTVLSVLYCTQCTVLQSFRPDLIRVHRIAT